MVTTQSAGARVRQIRKMRGMSQTELSDRIGYSRTNLVAIEQGKIDTGFTTMCAIARVLGVSVAALADETDYLDDVDTARGMAVTVQHQLREWADTIDVWLSNGKGRADV